MSHTDSSLCDRKTLRQYYRQARRQLTSQQQQYASEQMLNKLQVFDHFQASRHIALYLANDGELDLLQVTEYCWRQGKRTYLPVIHPFSAHHLIFLHFDQNSELVANRFGINEPVLACQSVCPLSQLDLICTPMVAFDQRGHRLGMGGGFYDRTLSHISHNTHLVGIAHDCQLSKQELPNEPWDVPLGTVLTPSKTYAFS